MSAIAEEGAKMNKINKCDSCNNVYSHRQSLWRHRQNCNNNNFLPRETSDLLPKLKEWAIAFADNGTAAALQFKIMAALDELRFRKVIGKEKYNDILKDMN